MRFFVLDFKNIKTIYMIIDKIQAALYHSGMTWNGLSTKAGRPRSYGHTLKRQMRSRIDKVNTLLGLFGYELNIQKKKA